MRRTFCRTRIFYKDTKECGGRNRRMYEYQGYQRQSGFYPESGDRREGGRYVQGIDRFEEGCGETRRDAERRGIKQGIEQGTCRTNKLIELFLSDGRQDDLLRSARDTLFQKKLFQEYNI